MRENWVNSETKNRFHLSRYKKSEREEVFAFLQTVYPKVKYDRLMKQWKWKYDENPFNFSDDPYLLMLREGSQIIGMMGAIPLCLSVNGKKHWAACSCDLIVHPTYRGQKLSRVIIRQYYSDHPTTFAWINKISERAGKPLTTSQSLRIVPLVKPLLLNLPLRKNAESHLLDRQGTEEEVTITQLLSVDHRFDSLWEQVPQNEIVIVFRDQAYLKWRFSSRPDARYILLAATRGSRFAGYLILRVAEKAAFRLGYLVDFLVERDSSSILGLLIEEATAYLKQEAVVAIFCLATNFSYHHLFGQQGFYPWYLMAPRRFHPRVALPDPNLQVIQNPRRWYLTIGDGDLEMSF